MGDVQDPALGAALREPGELVGGINGSRIPGESLLLRYVKEVFNP